MSAQWPHWIMVFEASSTGTGGSTNDDGIWVPNPDEESEHILYEGEADVQDSGVMFSRERSGQFNEESTAVAFLRRASAVIPLLHKANLKAQVTYEDGTTSIADVIEVRRLDGTVWLKRL